MPLTVYPNPNAGKFYVELKTSKCKSQKIELFDSSGQSIYEGKIEWNKTLLIDLKNIKSGDYVLFMENNQIEYRQQIIIQNPNYEKSKSVRADFDIEIPSLN